MLKKSIGIAILASQIAFLSATQVLPQSDKTPPAVATATVATPLIPGPLPFKFGETLTYDVSFSRLIVSGSIGRLSMTVNKTPDHSKTGLIELRAEAISKGFFTWLFGVRVKDRFKSLVSSEDFGLHSSEIQISEGPRRKEQKSIVDRETRQVTYTERNLSDKSAQPKTVQCESPHWVQDVLSAIYLIRAQSLKEGQAITVPISDAGKIYNVDIVVEKKEEVKVEAGRFKTLRLEAKIFDGRYVNRKGEMRVWVAEDGAKPPVKAKIKTSGATVTIELIKIECPGCTPAATQKTMQTM